MINKGWYFKNLHEFELVENEIPEPRENEVVIEVGYAGICGSDLHAFNGEHPLVAPGKILGHEFTGRIHKVGSNVENLKVGEAVVLEPSVTCGKCYNCTHGRYNICSNLDVIGCTATNGGFQKYVAVPARKVYSIRELSMKRATLTEPFAVGIHGVRMSTFKPGDEVLVIGSGPIGVFTIIFLYLSGAKRIVVVDLIDERLNLISKLCPGIIAIKPEDLDKKELFSFEGPDVVFECVGLDVTTNMAIENARKGSEVVILGVPPAESTIKLIYVQDRELKITGSLMYVMEDYLIAMELLKKNAVDFEKLITDIYPFEKLPEAFEYAQTNKSKAIKVLIKVGDYL